MKELFNTKQPLFTESENSIPSSSYLRLSTAGYDGNRASDVDDFSQIIAFNDLTSLLCARKFSFAPQGGIYHENAPF